MLRLAPLAGLMLTFALLLLPATSFAGKKGAPPNWRVVAAGTTDFDPDPESPLHVDEFAGKSSHLGRFHGEGSHLLDSTLCFDGTATFTAANGDELDIAYTGCVFNIDFDKPLPFEVLADVEIVGGTGRFASASGGGVMTGGFSGVPGDLAFTIEGTLQTHGEP